MINLQNGLAKRLVFAHNMPLTSIQHKGAMKFKELLEAYSEDSLVLDIIPNRYLGTDAEIIDKVSTGQLDFAIPPLAELTPFADNLKIMDLPYLFAKKKDFFKALNSEFKNYLFKGLSDVNLRPIGMWSGGYKNFTANKEITRPQHFSGLRMRIMASKALVSQAISLNAFPVFSDFQKITSFLDQGKIDCLEDSAASIYSFGIYKKQSHMILSRHAVIGQLMIASESTFSQLSEEQRQAVLRAATEASAFQQQLSMEESFIKKIRDSGTTQIVELSEKNIDEFIKYFSPLYYRHRDALKRFSDVINPKIHEDLEDHVAIGLSLSFTHHAYASALAIKRGAMLAVDEINKSGGVAGKRLMLITSSHDGFPQKGKKNLAKFAEDPSVAAILGGMHSPVILAERDYIKEINIPYLIPWAAATPIISEDNPNIYRFSVRDSFAGAKLVERAATYGKKIALVFENTGWGRSNESSVTKALKLNSELSLGGTFWFDWGKKDFSDLLMKVKESESNVIIFVGNSPEGVHLVKSLAASESKIPVVSHWGVTGGRFWEETRQELQKIKFSFLKTFKLSDENASERYRDFITNYRDMFLVGDQDTIPAIFGSIHAYELIKLFSNAASISDDLKPSSMNAALMSIKNHEGLFKNYRDPFSSEPFKREVLSKEEISFGHYDSIGNIIDD